ncbi:MAG: SRPBCC domain-containing protein [Rhodobacteraceae bacterium]|nr:SRPBCC domain-containing protein [Paracoccaceae bacterium]MCB1403315.1 SRPBCC domain-containing protein [Paracoccaceae bacterium]
MRPDLRFDFIADMQDGTLTIRREFAAGRQMVWDCYTRSELLDRWYAPRPLTTKTRSFDFREGGHWHFAMIDPNGTHYWSRTDYETITPIDGYTGYDGFTDETGVVNPDLPRSRQELRLADKGDHTLVETRVSYDSPEDLQKVIDMGMEEGLTSTLERLDELLASLIAEAQALPAQNA